MREDIALVLGEEFKNKVSDPDYLTVFDAYAGIGYPLTPELDDATGHFIMDHVDYLVDFADFVVKGGDYSLHNRFYKHAGLSLDDLIIKRSIIPEWQHMIFSSNSRFIEANTGCELAKLGYAPDKIKQLIPKVVGFYDRVVDLYEHSYFPKNVLSAAIRLSCKGSYQCPVSLKFHVKNSKSVFKKFPVLKNELKYDGVEFISNVFSRAKSVFNLSGDFLDTCDKYLMVVKGFPKALTRWRPTASAIVYLAGRDKGLTQKMIVNKLDLTGESTLRKYYQGIEKLYKQNSST